MIKPSVMILADTYQLYDYEDAEELLEEVNARNHEELEKLPEGYGWQDIPYWLTECGINDDRLWEYLDNMSRVRWDEEDAYFDYVDYNRDVSMSAFKDAYIGESMDDETWGHYLMDDSPAFDGVDEVLRDFFDFESYGAYHRDGTYDTDQGYMFWNN